MGLLTDPGGLHAKPFVIMVKRHGIICTGLYLLSVLWYCLLAHEQISAGTYLSENALLPGLVVVGCDVTEESRHILAELDYQTGSVKLPVEYFQKKFQSMGIESYKHNFTLNFPLGKKEKYHGNNVYGIIRGGGSSNEAIVLSAPYRSKSSVLPGTSAGIALLLSIANYFRKQKYWAKDIILLIIEHEQLGMHAWLEAYHGVTCGAEGVLDHGELWSRGGAIQAAINLEIASPKLDKIHVKMIGLDGQLPNLDLANLVQRICTKEKVRYAICGTEKIHNLPPNEQWVHSLKTMTSMVVSQASGVPDGVHGLFHRFGIEALTMEGIPSSEGRHYVSLHLVGRVVEGLFRSINNLLERFHQSFFFYLLTDTDRFVSIGFYILCICMMVGALIIRAFALNVNLKTYIKDLYKENRGHEAPDMNMAGVSMVLLGVHCFSALLSQLPQRFSHLFSQHTETGVFYACIFISFLTIVLPPILVMRWKEREWLGLHSVVLIYLTTLLLAVSMHNFSFAFISSLLIVPIALYVKPSENKFFKKLIVLLGHPLVVVSLAILLTTLYHWPKEEVPLRFLPALKSALTFAITDHLIYGSWSWTVVTLFYLPPWLMLWSLAHLHSPLYHQLTLKAKIT